MNELWIATEETIGGHIVVMVSNDKGEVADYINTMETLGRKISLCMVPKEQWSMMADCLEWADVE